MDELSQLLTLAVALPILLGLLGVGLAVFNALLISLFQLNWEVTERRVWPLLLRGWRRVTRRPGRRGLAPERLSSVPPEEV